MADFVFTNKAIEDLSDIWQYTLKKWSEKQADNYYHLLIETCTELAANPKLGKKYEEVHNDILGFRSSRHIIFYRKLSKSKIEITRILHAQMDLKNKWRE